MKKLTLLLLLLVAISLNKVQGHGSFQSYNNEAREASRSQNLEKLNDIDSVDVHWWGEPRLEKVPEAVPEGKYAPTWSSLDTRPMPRWFDESKIGIFIHWGVFSVPGFGSEWFWYYWKTGDKAVNGFVDQNYKPNTTYQEFAPEFTAEFYNPIEWAKLFEKSGAKYIVLTSKHHEGYTLWPSRNSFSWNSQDVGPHRDLVGDLAAAIRTNTSLRFGVYHSLFEFYNPLYLQDKANNFSTDEFVRFKSLPELYDLVNKYQPEVVWSDGEWEAEDTYWKAQEFLAWLYNDSPVRDTVVTNDRWGHDTQCKHGGYYTCGDKYNPGVLQPHKWENCFTLDKRSWGYRRNANIEDYLTPHELIKTIVETVSCGGNILVNVGPTREGMIDVIQQERLTQMGEWLEINGDAIYSCVAYTAQNDTVTPGVWYTMSADKSKVYGIVTNGWPAEGRIVLGSVRLSSGSKVGMLGTDLSLDWQTTRQGVVIEFPPLDKVRSRWVWTLVFSSLR